MKITLQGSFGHEWVIFSETVPVCLCVDSPIVIVPVLRLLSSKAQGCKDF